MTRSLPALIAMVLVAACGGNELGSSSTAAPSDGSASSMTVTAPDPPTGATRASTTAVDPVATTAVAESELADGFGLPALAIVSPEAGGGDRPDLSWESVDDAVDYRVTVLDPGGAVYWGWSGETTDVPFGGRPRLEPTAAGPRVVPGMTWTVLAIDDDGVPLAAGGPVPLSP